MKQIIKHKEEIYDICQVLNYITREQFLWYAVPSLYFCTLIT